MKKIIIIAILVIFLIASFVLQERIIVTFGFNYQPKKVILTFDDGPHPDFTPQVLSELNRHDIKAMFFVVGQEVTKYPDLTQLINQQGHLLANHTYSHNSIYKLSSSEIEEELLKTNRIIEKITGKKVKHFRPPRGLYTHENLKFIEELGFNFLMWDMGLEKMTIDNPEELVATLLSRIEGKNELVLLLHDGSVEGNHDRSLTIKALPLLIEKLQIAGYQFIDPQSIDGETMINKYNNNYKYLFKNISNNLK